ncbi:MAG: hypothetical protein ACI9R3_003295 [Verrucomicrobiales bacterium]|jgi:hypothetical protein
MLAVREASGGEHPTVIAYWRQDEEGFIQNLKQASPESYGKLLEQKNLAQWYIEGRFMDEQGSNFRSACLPPSGRSTPDRLHSDLPILKLASKVMLWASGEFALFCNLDLYVTMRMTVKGDTKGTIAGINKRAVLPVRVSRPHSAGGILNEVVSFNFARLSVCRLKNPDERLYVEGQMADFLLSLRCDTVSVEITCRDFIDFPIGIHEKMGIKPQGHLRGTLRLVFQFRFAHWH